MQEDPKDNDPHLITQESLQEGSLAPRVSRSVDEIKKLAKAAYQGQVFTSLQMHDWEMREIPMVFLPLLFIDEIALKQIGLDDIRCVYGYMDECMPRSINGLPIFSSCGLLNPEETQIFVETYMKIKELMDGI